MQSEYWKSTEVQETYKKWLEFYEGCAMCACDHGCNQWIKEQTQRNSLFHRILSNKNATTSLDKVAQIPLAKINKIWYRIQYGEMRTFNRKLREERRANQSDGSESGSNQSGNQS